MDNKLTYLFIVFVCLQLTACHSTAYDGAHVRTKRQSGVDSASDLFTKYINELTPLLSGKIPKSFPKELTDALNLDQLFNSIEDLTVSKKSKVSCEMCDLIVSSMFWSIRADLQLFNESFLSNICQSFIYPTQEICDGIIDLYWGELLYIIKNSDVTALQFCSMALRPLGCDPYSGKTWSVDLPPSPPLDVEEPVVLVEDEVEVTTNGIVLENDSEINANDTPILKVLHLTDVHYDPGYQSGYRAVCDAPTCCTKENGLPTNTTDAAGEWGDYRSCDTPKKAFESMLQHIVETHPDIDYIICTGDIGPHHLWKSSEIYNENIISEYWSVLKSYFPDKILFGAIGNHETHPANSFPPFNNEEISKAFPGNAWLYQTMFDHWSNFTNQTLPSSILTGGYYSVVVKPGFRLISLNTNFCYVYNWWVLYNSTDPGNVLQWLVTELKQAEENKELVHIIGHIAPHDNDCYEEWSHQFSRIISRFAHIVKGQFYGHTHYDEFRIHYDVNDVNNTIGIQYISPNNGAYTNLNPAYRVYYIDGDHDQTTRDILDHETYYMNLTHANAFNEPKWTKLYSAKRDFELPDLSPKSWEAFTERLKSNDTLLEMFYRFRYRNAEPYQNLKCDEECRKNMICLIKNGDDFLPNKC